MGYYTNVKCSAVVKKKFIPVIDLLHKSSSWKEVHQKYTEILEEHGIKWNNDKIPFGFSCYLQECKGWEKIHHEFNATTGVRIFS